MLQVLAAEGIPGLFRGFGPAMVRSVPANATAFVLYEVAKKALT
jgi:solute carrier family 25 (mitochondrial carnitine/acylcarnitine transporter), member 20/29